MPLDIDDMPFRPEAPKDRMNWFDRDAHIQMYAAMLDALRAHVGDAWYRLSDEHSVVHLGPEVKRTISTLIRKCSESCDYPATVDFVTKSAMMDIEKRALSRPGQRVWKGDLAAQAHEHMCPNNVVSRCLTSPEFRTAGTADILKLLSFRALVARPRAKAGAMSARAEVHKLDANFKDTVPKTDEIAELVGKEVPLKYYPLLRYHKVGLLADLIAVTSRARILLSEYQEFTGMPTIGDAD